MVSLVTALGFMTIKTIPLLIVIPFIVSVFYGSWVVEQTRILRLGEFLLLLECGINLAADKPIIMWEAWRKLSRGGNAQMLHRAVYWIIDIVWFFVLFLLTITSTVIMLPTLYDILPGVLYYLIALCSFIPSAILIVLFVLFIKARSRWHSIDLRTLPDKYNALRKELSALWLQVKRG